MNEYQRFSNIVSVSSLQDAINRVFIPNSIYVFLCEPDNCFYVVALDAVGNRQCLKYVKEQPKDSYQDRLLKLEEAVYGSKTFSRNDESYETSSNSGTRGDGSIVERKEPASSDGNTEAVIFR